MTATEQARRMMFERKDQRIKRNEDDSITCSYFGCGKKLTLIESLAGGKCTGCMSKNKITIDKVLKYE